ncbi:MAG: DUF72 domain-containing protein [Thermoplasmata archaeon]
MGRIFIGCSGWFYTHWSGTFYPQGMPTKNWFRYYASLFDTVELNSTFYSFPNSKRAAAWYRSSPKDFRYSVKMNRMVTHVKRLGNVDDDVSRFKEAISPLREKLACILVQLPPSFRFTKENLDRVFGVVEGERRVFVEFRHSSWYSQEALDVLRRKGIRAVTVSMKGLPFILPDYGDVYVRMHGDVNGYATDYSDERLKELGKRLVGRHEDAYIYFNNDYHGFAPKNALFLKGVVEGK